MNRHLGQQHMKTEMKNAEEKGSRGMKEQRVDSLVQGTQVFSRGMLRGISCVVMTTYLTLVAAPAAAAVRQEVFGRPKPLTENSIAQSELAQLREAVRQHRLERQLAARAPETATDKLKALFTDSPRVKAEKALAETLLGARERLQAEAARQDAEMASTRADLVRKKLPEVILARHDAAVKTIAERRAGFMADLDQLQQADARDDDAQRAAQLQRLGEKLEAWGGKQQAKTDYKHLPWGSPDSKVRAPHASKLAYQLNLEMFGIKPLRVAGPIPAGTVLPVLPKLPSTPQAADLGETEDIQLTPAIRAKAAELHHNPVEIYRWVHDNIEYIPTYGSIQGADYALQTKRGNAFDTSSLLIGLLRASGIPARYVYGTVEVPMDKAMNWVGGVTNPNAVLELMGQGGIPNIGLTMGGKLVAVRMEHVWVEAFVDFVPSRGVKNRVPDTWVPMDGSYKQYSYTAAVNLKEDIPFDFQGLVDGVQADSSIDEAQGYVQNVSQSRFQSALSGYQDQIKAYIEQRSVTDLGEVIGAKTIRSYEGGGLGQVLPLSLTAVAGEFQALPSSMRHYFNYTIYNSIFDRNADSYAFSRRLSLPSLAGKSLALSFRPSSSYDEQAIRGFLPEAPADGSSLRVSDFPTSLPGYLISVTPELSVNGNVVAAGGGVSLGEDVYTRASIDSPNSSLSGRVSENIITAGEYHAIAIDGQGLSSTQLKDLKGQLERTRKKLLEGGIDKINVHEFTGVTLQMAAQGYFVANNIQGRIMGKSAGVVVERLPSYGTFSVTFQTMFSWGIPRQVANSGATMDMDQVSTLLIDSESDSRKVKAFRMALGSQMSANEHLMTEKVLSTNSYKAKGVSAVKALQIAASQGQRIYTINRANVDAVLPGLLIAQETKSEIVNAVVNGMEVTTSAGMIDYAGWKGSGYIVHDPESGAGAYKISGGQNGARAILDFAQAHGVWFGIIGIIAAALVGALSATAAFVVGIFFSLFAYWAGHLSLLEAGCPTFADAYLYIALGLFVIGLLYSTIIGAFVVLFLALLYVDELLAAVCPYEDLLRGGRNEI